MNRPITLYMDETGNRHPNKKADNSRIGRDWFGFGGILVKGEDNDTIRELRQNFAIKWKQIGRAHV